MSDERLGRRPDRVVLLDEDGNPAGLADKATVHHHETPLHLAFSSYIFNRRNDVLLTRRSLKKRTWPGVWTNSCCGHATPGESMPYTVARRIREELGIVTRRIDLVLPGFRYRATMRNGIVENEMCPVWRVFADGEPTPDPAEVASMRWQSWSEFVAWCLADSSEISPWCREQLPELMKLGEDPAAWPTANAEELPPAALDSKLAWAVEWARGRAADTTS